MTIAQTSEPTPREPLRLWPGVVLVILQWLIRFGVPVVAPQAGVQAILAGLIGGAAILLWWLFFSRAPWLERVGASVLMVVALFATSRVVHESLARAVVVLIVFAVPVLSLALVAWAVASRRLPAGPRLASMAAAILLACAALTLVRVEGITGDFGSEVRWRWTPTPEERLLAQAGDEPAAVSGDAAAPATAATPETRLPLPTSPPRSSSPISQPSPGRGEGLLKAGGEPAAVPGAAIPRAVAAPAAAAQGVDWPGFRGPERDGAVRGVRIETDWAASPPVELWRRPIGPGWSSFAVHGDLLYTQEQRGEDEVVTCYNRITGEPLWKHHDAARFWELASGAGPRATPALGDGRVYTLGATGILNALDARDGSVVWTRNAAADTGAKLPDWGFAGSPLVVGDVIVVATAGRLIAYDAATGDPRWKTEGGGSYSSPQLATIDGVAQVLLLKGAGAISVAPADGTLLWEHKWPGDGIVQPALTADGDVLIGAGSGMAAGMGVCRLAVGHGPGGWTVQERWTSNGLKPYFNDFVVHKGHAFGFDGSMLASIDLADGKRTWKGGRYGHGQLILLPDQDLLLVLSEKGELALVEAAPDQFTELARFPAVEGKTWNHPVLAGDVLLVRNDEEMAAFRLPLAGDLAGKRPDTVSARP